ncbi:TIM barrel protein [Bythopirellula polymerisocia]|uniref:Xylose isomerase n=1 Tax=Bythopirellula polymerisocia TaxID=2528003 RepID=A0A5C6CGD2_9BACT|nr:TIM barrel protein [Bythopirellula polymerisocia]TWU22787.1 Xylose isomerase [Bythopirellula polymerisocia]
MSESYRFSFGPWNIHGGADPFGPATRNEIAFAEKLKSYQELGFEGVQLHDDDAVPNLANKSATEISAEARQLKSFLADNGLVPEFVAPRLWEDPHGIDGGFTANDPNCRKWALDRSKRAIDIANDLGVNLLVLWCAREGTYIREAKCARTAYARLLEAVNSLLEYDSKIRIAIEPKPNEPVDQAYLPTIGHALALAGQTDDPLRVGGLIETAHAQLTGLDPSDEMAFALQMDKLWSVHLNDQNGLKFDQDKTFGSVNLRAAFNQVRVLEEAGYARTGRFVGLDVKAMRTQSQDKAHLHLANSKQVFLRLVEKSRSLPLNVVEDCVKRRDYESLEMVVLNHLMSG